MPGSMGEPFVRETHQPVRTLVKPTDANLRETHQPVRTLVKPTDAKLRETHQPVRTLVKPTDAKLRATLIAVRVLRLNTGIGPFPHYTRRRMNGGMITMGGS